MGLDINLYKVLTKSEVTKLKNKYDVTDLVYPEKDNCEELDKIYFIEIEALINCDTNIETLNNFKHCLIEKEITYYNVQAMILKSNVKTKYSDLSDYYISFQTELVCGIICNRAKFSLFYGRLAMV